MADRNKPNYSNTPRAIRSAQESGKPNFSKEPLAVTGDVGGGEAGSVAWGNVTGKPATYPPAEHDHDGRYYTKDEVDGHIEGAEETYRVKATEDDDSPDFLDKKVDNVTIEVEDGELKVKNIDGLTLAATQLNSWLTGTSRNVQAQFDDLEDLLNTVAAGMRFTGKEETNADMQGRTVMENGDVVVVLADEERDDARTMYVYSDDKGMWDYIGAFQFSDDFIALKDTPNSYDGQDGRVLKADETNERLVFSDIEYEDLENRPSSTVTQIDDAVEKRHGHGNKSALDRLGIDSNGNLTIDGVALSIQKEYLQAGISGGPTINRGDPFPFNITFGGSVPLDADTGLFTLTAGKPYRITFNTRLAGFDSYTLMYVADSSGGGVGLPICEFYRSDGYTDNGVSGTLDVIFTPLSTGEYMIRSSGDKGPETIRFVDNRTSLVIQEI